MSTDPNIATQTKPRFPLREMMRQIYSRTQSRKDFYLLYAPMRRWDDYIAEQTPHNLRLTRRVEEMDFSDYKLSDEEKQAAIEMYQGGDEILLDAMDSINVAGYRTTFSYDRKNSCSIVSLICRDEESPNFEKCMTTRHGSVRTALVYACYKQIIVFSDTKWPTEGNESLWG